MISALGRTVITFLNYLGEVGLLARETFIALFVSKIRWRLVLQQMYEIGTRSQLVVAVTGAFTGAVFAAQLYFQLKNFGMESTVGSVTAVAIFRELGPALSGLMVAGRVGAAIAAEIGTMKVTEQVDALRALGVHPVDYLVIPRTIAMLVSMPLLVLEACALALVACYLVSVQMLGVAEAGFMRNLIHWVVLADLYKAAIKAFIFGGIIVFVACHQGLKTSNGAAGVGRAPTEAVVISSLSILVCNFILTFALNVIFPVDS
jgi:phospholipid/cholesterol/gamma-HCH transport system permease protein